MEGNFNIKVNFRKYCVVMTLWGEERVILLIQKIKFGWELKIKSIQDGFFPGVKMSSLVNDLMETM